jgi:hypothetical protein
MYSSLSHVCILGCGRSGTSIFGELFEHLPSYTYHSEPPFEDVLQYDYSKTIAIKVPRESFGYEPDTGLSFPLNTFLQAFPEPRQLYWIVRHPLDAICSLKVGISKNWGHHPQPPDWRDWLSEPLVKQCAYHWNYLNTRGYNSVKHLVKIKHFEDLILNPLPFAQTICEELGVDQDMYLQEIQAWSNRVQNSNNAQFIEAKTSSAYSTQDHSVRVERWRENMTSEEYEWVKPMVVDTAARFGYEL